MNPFMPDGLTIVALVVLVVVITFIVKAVRIVPQQHAWVVERLGKYHATLGPGLNIVIPFIDRVAYKHSLKEVPLDVPSQVCITRDNTQLAVDGVLYFQVTDPQRASLVARLSSLCSFCISSCRPCRVAYQRLTNLARSPSAAMACWRLANMLMAMVKSG